MLATNPKQVGHVSPYSTFGELFLSFVQQTCQNNARTIEISSISPVHSMHGWAIPEDDFLWEYLKIGYAVFLKTNIPYYPSEKKRNVSRMLVLQLQLQAE